MATRVQRWSALCEALLGKPATAAQLLRIGQGIAAKFGQAGVGQFNLMTNAQKADYCIAQARQHFLDMVRQNDLQVAANNAVASVPDPTVEFPEVVP